MMLIPTVGIGISILGWLERRILCWWMLCKAEKPEKQAW